MDSLSTVLSTVLLLLCAGCWWLAQRAEQNARGYAASAHDASIRLREQASDLIAMQGAITALKASLRKLDSRLSVTLREARRSVQLDEEEEAAVAEIETQHRASRSVPCDNWRKAQLEGPFCEAAQCDCAYCTAKRDERRGFRALQEH